ncbi:MAG: bifunctional (p)ppGpp synthetase/guanosine-3',5'-bis(diphosphate) 3'-pyrophosphohydrolase [Firmicutes bacterium]|nr:bifunctional (p)ppGpp synthetase/guanosine-3',5'-bis(diphosphate) 3'-pyrophosphohydrolase [Bacillota bacterium]
MAVTIDDIINSAKAYNPSSDGEKIRAAYALAEAAHQDQKRDSGEPYITHPLEVAHILTSLQIDDTTIIAGLLHDVVEDTTVSAEAIEEQFGTDVCTLVQGVTKLSKLEFRTRHDAQAENLRKMFMAMSSDIRIILVKLADRLHNMRTISGHHSALRQKEIAEETLSIYAPLAHRLGIFKIKNELEDLSIAVLEPERIAELKRQMAQEKDTRDKFVQEHITKIKEAVSASGINCEVYGRTKNYYSIFNKMNRQQKELSEIFDLNAVRIIVNEINECYEALGIIHSMWKPIPGRFKDYIAMPKPNMYQSIHTTLIADNGTPFEVQIRTWEMHRIAEYGIAAHWRYKEGRSADADFDKKIEWLRQMLEWQQDVGDAQEFMTAVKGDLFNDNIYVFSPKGDIYELPSGAVPLDFAYRVHTEVGHSCVGAKINHRLVPLDTRLHNGDIVEVLTAKGRGPSRDWLKLCKSQQAKNKIRQWFRKEHRDENILAGKEAFEKECRKQNIDTAEVLESNVLQDICKRFNCAAIEDLYAGFGSGDIRLETVINKLKDDFRKLEPPPIAEINTEQKDSKERGDSIIVQGLDGVMVHLAACCRPLPGDDVIGYITKGRGVSVHRTDCPNAVRYYETEADRLIPVRWGSNATGLYNVEMEAVCVNRERLLMDIMAIMAETKTEINGVHVSIDKRNKTATVYLKIEVKSLDQLDYLMQRVRRVKDVMDVYRVLNSRNRFHSKDGA